MCIALNSAFTHLFTLTALSVQHFSHVDTFPTSNGVHSQKFRAFKFNGDFPVSVNLKLHSKSSSIPQSMGGKAKHHLNQTFLTCNILLMRKERTKLSKSCCDILLSGDIFAEYLYIICRVCKSYLKDIFIHNMLLRNICSQKPSENISENLTQYFEVFNQKKKRKVKIHILTERAAKTADVKSFNSTILTTEDTVHITKRDVNTTGNSTIPGIPDWETLLQMQYSKDPQWALICVVFVVTLVLGCVWYCGMCKGVHGEYIDPVVTHNIKPEFVRDLVLRKARFLAWFKYLKNMKKQYQQRVLSESEKLLSSTDEEDLFDQTEMTNY